MCVSFTRIHSRTHLGMFVLLSQLHELEIYWIITTPAAPDVKGLCDAVELSMLEQGEAPTTNQRSHSKRKCLLPVTFISLYCCAISICFETTNFLCTTYTILLYIHIQTVIPTVANRVIVITILILFKCLFCYNIVINEQLVFEIINIYSILNIIIAFTFKSCDLACRIVHGL